MRDVYEALEVAAKKIGKQVAAGITEPWIRVRKPDYHFWVRRTITRHPHPGQEHLIGVAYYEAAAVIGDYPLLFDTGACVMWGFDLDKLVERLHEVINRHEELELTRQRQAE